MVGMAAAVLRDLAAASGTYMLELTSRGVRMGRHRVSGDGALIVRHDRRAKPMHGDYPGHHEEEHQQTRTTP
ncbi:hypothetical protein GCM10023317_96190 [Actinopolymorpha pittospori]